MREDFQFMKNFKLVKTTAALALGASVVTAAVVPGATDASAASKYKVSHGKLVNAKTGKVVKGYVVFKSKLYHNGKLRQGYKTVGTGKSIKLYFNGSLKKGYKTARNNKLLFQNGSLKKGWKTAGAGERLYKNGFLSKGYEVYGDLDKSPSLYYNGYLKSGYKTANNASLLFYNGKLKAGLKDAKGGTVLYDNGRLSKGLVEFKEKFYNDGKLANGEIDGVVYKDGKVVAGVATLKALNATTVEVSFKNAIENLDDLKFTVDGLDVKNAVVKQTDNKTVVLTTSAQEGNKEYTLKLNGDSIGKFKGVSAVIPTNVAMTTASVQGTIGKDVTVSAKVAVPEGQSKAGIPVTFNIVNSSNNNEKIEKVAYTDENGVASYSYTRYYSSNDNVTAYATDKSSVYAKGMVYWANASQLTIKDLTEATSLVNGSKKVYEVEAPDYAGKYVFVAFEENVNVAPDKAVSGAKVEGLTTYAINGAGEVLSTVPAGYPYQYTTGGKAVTAVKLDSKGKANLVVTGSNATVTPLVYTGAYDVNTNNQLTKLPTYSATALQAKGSTVKFELKHDLGLTIKAEGVQNAATYKSDKETGGRDYTVTYTDKDGKAAAPGTKVLVAIDTTGVKGNLHVLDSDNKELPGTLKGNKKYYTVTVEKDGKASFTVSSTEVNDYFAPVVFIDNGKASASGELDSEDLQSQGEITYVVANVTYAAELTAVDQYGNPVTAVVANGSEFADFEYNLVDQNGKPRSSSDATTVSFEVKAGTGIVYANETKVNSGETKTVNAVIDAGKTKAHVRVVAQDPSSVTVSATGSRAGVVLPSTNPGSVTVNFSQYGTAAITGNATSVNTVLDIFTINNIVYSYDNGTYQYKGNTITKSAFEGYIKDNTAKVSITKDADGKFTFNVLETSSVDGSSNVINASVLAAVNGAGTKAEIEKAIKGLTLYSQLTADGKTAVIDDIYAAVVTGNTAYTTSGALTSVFNAYITKVTAAAYTAPVVAQASAVTNEETIATGKTVKFTSPATAAYNGYTIKFVEPKTTGGTIATEVDRANKVIKVTPLASTIGGSSVTYTSTVNDVVSAINTATGATFTATNAAEVVTDAMVAKEFKFNNAGIDGAAAAAPAELKLTADKNFTDALAGATVKVNGVEGTLKAGLTSSKVATIVFANGVEFTDTKITSLEGLSSSVAKNSLVFSDVTITK